MYRFVPGVAYKFTPCFEGIGGFVAVAAERSESREVGFVLPLDLVCGVAEEIDGREYLKVHHDGFDFCASAAAPLDVSAAFEVLGQIRAARAKKV